ncbi:nicotinate phosphoribosyltransferase [Leptolyngbya cf. ectocarpi LEGE 11479]|uniref:Nicotinate phosphoribosyltransferase n=1 Tax=Leptolyngbya cf. ectocarpi LEGE 11479 TaxID=1828722 RepID=A0A928ZVW5_LEPEC|nr:nicotinate phosphoribosyltransferase [Leptolyngbya ectocarpi]MBE9068416.1 nicotinate phosphoribosyltransferase [Leptolyngbya cf. ectocarpi LEGE 11479]
MINDASLLVQPDEYGLLTDLYQLTMAACYVGEGLDQRRASFELFVRRLPEGFGYLIAAGLASALDYLEKFQFTPEQLAALQATDIFTGATAEFWHLLASGRFCGDVWAVPEGTAIFANEPILRVEAPLWQAQIVETYLLNAINYQTLIATRAARLRDVAGPEAKLLEFGTRRAFSPQASLWAARAALAGGLDATSNVLAALKLGRKPVGTMAHALVMAITALEGSETDSFEAFHRYFPGAALLIDTYDTVAAAQRLGKKMPEALAGVRLDSGDLVTLSQQVRQELPEVPIFASGDLDEQEIWRLRQAGACIDGYGLGTKLVTGSPVNGVYKLTDIDGIPVMKESSGKFTYPGRKQIFRSASGDRLGLATESAPTDAEELLIPVMRHGQRLEHVETLDTIRTRASQSVAQLPETVRDVSHPEVPQAEISTALQTLTDCTRRSQLATVS